MTLHVLHAYLQPYWDRADQKSLVTVALVVS